MTEQLVAALGWLFRWLPMVLEIAGLIASALFFGLHKAIRHSLCLYGRRTFSGEYITYRFAIQNNEDVSLRGRWRVKIRILNPYGAFTKSSALDGSDFVIYAGCNDYDNENHQADGRTRSFVFQELPAYDTWTIDCSMTPQSRDVQVEIESAVPEHDSRIPAPAKSLLSHYKLNLAADRTSALAGRKVTPERSWAWLIIAFCASIYVIFVLNFIPDYSYEWLLLVTGTIVLFGWLTLICVKREAPPIVQGYWADSEKFR